MLRLWVLILVLCNSAYFAWSQGWLLDYGFGPTQQREPQRLAQQINPQVIQILSAQEAEQLRVSPKVQGAQACLQAGLFDEAQASALSRVLETTLAPGAWGFESVTTPQRWIVYMGKYANVAELDKKRAQLASLKLTFEPLTNAMLAPGLSLGGFATQADATAALEVLARRGVRTARVLLEQPSVSAYQLRLPEVDEAMQRQLAPLRSALAGKVLGPC